MANRILLVWKYFFQQKYKEAKENLHVVIVVNFTTAYFLAAYFLAVVAWTPEETRWWAAYIVYIITGFWILLLLIFLLGIISEWLKNNWELANNRADEELRNLKQRSKKQ